MAQTVLVEIHAEEANLDAVQASVKAITVLRANVTLPHVSVPKTAVKKHCTKCSEWIAYYNIASVWLSSELSHIGFEILIMM